MNLTANQISDQLNQLRRGWPGLQTRSPSKQRLHERVLWWDQPVSIARARRLGLRLKAWQWDEWELSKSSVLEFQGDDGRLTVVRPSEGAATFEKGHRRQLAGSDYSRSRETIGEILRRRWIGDGYSIHLTGYGCSRESWLGALVAVDLAAYDFRRFSSGHGWPKGQLWIDDAIEKIDASVVAEARRRSAATNWARHLVNLPPNVINPESMAKALMRSLRRSRGLRMELWDVGRLRKEGMGLHLGVGAASDHPPCLLKAHYRPQKSRGMAPFALVGKGITFDSGGLNLKPAANMRWMKKDMGGSAAVAGLMLYAVQSQHPTSIDFYLALAENAVGGDAFCPGDILTSRAGKTVEIHNTDAEGRLVLADALDVAVTQKTKPKLVIDVATLTGAIKAGLGSSVAGLFANDDKLLEELERSMNQVGDWVWSMPLVPKYRSQLRSTVADLVNATDGFGGAITAALFLEEFVRDASWAHLDIYAWKDSAEGPIREQGASGQAVEGLIQFINTRAKVDRAADENKTPP